MDPVQKVFEIDGLRLLILSYSLDKVKKKKINITCRDKIKNKTHGACLCFFFCIFYRYVKFPVSGLR
jgi:hypothetical protein